MASADLILDVTPPFRLDLTAWTLRRRQKNTTDQWDGQQYTRAVVLCDMPVKMTITQVGTADKPQLHVVLQSQEALSGKAQEYARLLIQKIFGLSVGLQPFYSNTVQGCQTATFPDCF